MTGERSCEHGGPLHELADWVKGVLNHPAATRHDLEKIGGLLQVLITIGGHVVSKLDDLISEVKAESDLVQSAIKLIDGFAKKLEEAGTDDGRIQELLAQVKADRIALAAAVTANTSTGDSSSSNAGGTGGGTTGGDGSTGGDSSTGDSTETGGGSTGDGTGSEGSTGDAGTQAESSANENASV